MQLPIGSFKISTEPAGYHPPEKLGYVKVEHLSTCVTDSLCEAEIHPLCE